MEPWLRAHPQSILAIFPALLLVLFPTVWVVSLWVLSRVSGWHRLAEKFRVQEEPGGFKIGWQSARIGWVNYNNCLTFSADSRAMYMSVQKLLSLAHPPLAVPWEEVRIVGEQGWWIFRGMKMLLGFTEQVPVVIRISTAEKLKTMAGARWPQVSW